MLSEVQYRCVGRYREAVIVLLLTVLAFSVRLYRVDFNSLSEDEVAKWAAVQEYRHGHFVGVNSEHPMLPKMLAWASLTTGERWGRVAATHGWPSLNPEGWLRLPNVLFGAATHRNPLFALPSNDGCCRVFCGEFFLGSCALASGVESAYEGGNAAHLLHPAGLLFLLSRPTGRCGPDCTAMVRPERNQLWPGSCLAVHSSPAWLECDLPGFLPEEWG